MVQLIISDVSKDYLVGQRGEFAHLAGNVAEWYDAYYSEIQKTVNQLGCQPFHVLDIGSGLGVVDAILIKHYGAHCTLIDAEHGDGTCTKHGEPFGNRQVTERFMADNNISPDAWRYCDPTKLSQLSHQVYDLVISFRSWCFHYPPSVYIDYVRSHLRPGGRLIVDLRENKHDWRYQLGCAFYEAYTVEQSAKFCRTVYIMKGTTQ